MEDKKTNCIFCSLGCGLIIRVDGKKIVGLDYDRDNPVNRGSLCPRGNYMYELLMNPNRLECPRIREDKMLRMVRSDEAIAFAAERLQRIKKTYGGGSIGIVLGSDLFNEDIYAAWKLFKEALGEPNIALSLPVEDATLLEGGDRKMGFELKEPKLSDIGESDALIIIGDILTRAPVLSWRLNDVKYKRRGKVIVIDPERSHTSWFATTHLQPVPGTESKLLAGIIKCLIENKTGGSSKFKRHFEKIDIGKVSGETGVAVDLIRRAAKEFAGAKKGNVIIVSGFRDKLLMELAKVLASAAGGNKGVMPFYSSGNAIGAYKMVNLLRAKRGMTYSEMIDGAACGRIKALLIFRADPIKGAVNAKLTKAIYNLKFLSVSDVYRTQIMDYADVIFPLASTLEGRGSISFSGRSVGEIDPVIAPAGGMSASSIAMEILKKLKGGVGRFPNEKEIYLEARKKLRTYKPKGRFLISRIYDELRQIKLPKAEERYPLRIYLKDDIVHSGDGSVTAKHFWANRECASAYAEINAQDAKALRVPSGGRVLLKTDKGEIIISARVTSTIPRGIVALPHHFQEIRELVSGRAMAQIEGLG